MYYYIFVTLLSIFIELFQYGGWIMSVKRIYVEKRPGFFDTPAQKLCADLKSMFTVTDLRFVRIFRRYDIEGMTDEEFSKKKLLINGKMYLVKN